MKGRYTTRGIILTRTNFDEADRIITFLTENRGKVRGIAKGVRKSGSKLAGGIELFSVSDLTFIEGKSEINTLISTRLIKHYGNIVKDLDRANSGYGFIKRINKTTEHAADKEYFDLLEKSFNALDNLNLSLKTLELWFNMQLLKLAGHSPNLLTSASGKKLSVDTKYTFDLDKMAFSESSAGRFSANHIKFLRLALSVQNPEILARVEGSEKIADELNQLVETMLKNHVRL